MNKNVLQDTQDQFQTGYRNQRPETSGNEIAPQRRDGGSNDHSPHTSQCESNLQVLHHPIDDETLSAFELMKDLLPVMDNLERAILTGQHSGDFDEFMEAVEVVRNQFFDTLTNHGLQEVSGSWSPFNSTQHVAVGHEDDDGHPHGSVMDVVEQGYRLRDRVLRPSKVIVSRNRSIH
ncbi:nucleotide exchange factor GrpE [Rhodopirellula sp. SWK7]|uniref:nucleotide exchange factor GrpE n=1 Tax=Rhodopirellula sp. SWK7 TaxID=595460 RepID=UPI0002BF9D22|nr:nucleotide exchange factor GrpE [Rhodopirellula sp. SWK7]EMI42956.1 GrpE nucleotide exchange factor [Rhodopirellula sp. SWK7]